MVALAQRHDLFERGTLLGLGDRARLPGAEELRQLVAAEGVAEHAKGARRVAEAFGGLCRGRTFNIEGAQCLVLALARRAWLAEEAAAFRYVFWWLDHCESQCQIVNHSSSASRIEWRRAQ